MSSALGGALGMSSTYTWAQVVSAITGVANKGGYSKTFTPATSYQSASSGAGYYSSVSVACNAVSLSGNASTSQVLTGRTFYTTSLTRQTGTMANRGNLNWSGSNTTYSVPAGYYSGGTLDSRTSYNNGYNAGVSAKTSRYASGSKSWSRAEFLTLGFQPNIFMVCGAGGTGSPNGLYCTIGVNMNYARGTSNSSYDNLFYTNANGIGLRDINITYWRDRASVWFAARIV